MLPEMLSWQPAYACVRCLPNAVASWLLTVFSSAAISIDFDVQQKHACYFYDANAAVRERLHLRLENMASAVNIDISDRLMEENGRTAALWCCAEQEVRAAVPDVLIKNL